MNLIQHWFIHKIFDQPQTIVVNAQVEPPTPSVVQCKDKDFCVAYGYKNYYEYEDDNIFKLYADEQTGNNEYAEFTLDNIVSIRRYRDGSDYISTDGREWKKFECKGRMYIREGRYLSVNDKLWEIYDSLTRV